MYISKYNSVDVVNGEGTRCSLFVSGCDHQCKGCYNKKTWKPDFGYEFTKEMEDAIIKDLKDTFIKRRGISLSGGDPLYKNNLNSIYSLVKRIKKECPEKDIWLWSGYTLKDIQKNKNTSDESKIRYKIIQNIDVFIDGKFEENQKDIELKWRGSSNQLIHRFNTKKT